jgi:hypothetical protein
MEDIVSFYYLQLYNAILILKIMGIAILFHVFGSSGQGSLDLKILWLPGDLLISEISLERGNIEVLRSANRKESKISKKVSNEKSSKP